MRGGAGDEPERIGERVRRLLSGDDPVPDDDDDAGYRPLTWQSVAGAPTGDLPGVAAAESGSAAPRRVRAAPSRRSVLAVGVAAALVALATLLWVRSSQPSSSALAPAPSTLPTLDVSAPPSPAASAPAGACISASGGEVVVDVAGKVRHPGVVTLPAGARVVDAIKAAGGALPGVSLTALNLAAPVTDGAHIAVGVPDVQSRPAATGGASAAGAAGGLVNLNTASTTELEALPGVGPVLAQHIVDYRTQHGPFTAVDQLNQVPGIGEVKFAALKPLVTV